MKKIIYAVVVILGVSCAMTSCVDDEKVQTAISLQLAYEGKVHAYDKAVADSVNNYDYDSQLATATTELEEAREEYLRHYATMDDDDREAYKKLANECRSADEKYLGSVYEEGNDTDELHTLTIQQCQSYAN